ncbi:MAG TPA: histidine kinase dimerization/phospho-acceptor domain-containing protein [Methylomirabilota bacterium]|nr:histidine kinase dimerization/phospho-acceptor domain-containing protein [Methylomirabilota bacterium]
MDSALGHVLSEARALAADGRDAAPLVAAIDGLASAIHEAQRRRVDQTRRFAHELRSPLNALAGWAQILRDGGGDPATATQAAGVIERSVAALSRTIQAYAD